MFYDKASDSEKKLKEKKALKNTISSQKKFTYIANKQSLIWERETRNNGKHKQKTLSFTCVGNLNGEILLKKKRELQ